LKARQKSDDLIVAVKGVKASGAKGVTERRSRRGSIGRTGDEKLMAQESKGIRWQSENRAKVQNLMHLVNEETLREEHRKQSGKKATGIDGVTKDKYGEQLDKNLQDLIDRMRQFSYKPQAVRRTYIPKANGKRRPLGIPSYEDKLVQGVMADILNDVYEPRFMDSSYGFRPERNQHQVVRIINQTIMTRNVNYVLEADIKGFFDNVNHDWLMKFLGNDIEDKNYLRYIKRFLIAGVMEDGQYQASDRGTPQGGLISPILANVYLHYVLDWWFETCVKPHLEGEAYYVRFADDFLVLFQYEKDAERVMERLSLRLKAFSLELAEEKTRILPIGRYKGTKEDFDFLGFTFFNTKTREGKYRLGVRTSKKKLKAKKQGAKEWLRTQLTKPVAETMKLLASVVRGHCNYYGVSGNFRCIQKYWKYLKYEAYRMLNRRDQKGRLPYPKFLRIWNFYVPKPRLTKDIWHWQPKTV
jgi:group II intron reverse transcriptase/maturase